MTMRCAYGIMEFPNAMSYPVAFAVLILLLPVAVVLVGLANLRRHTVRTADAVPTGPTRISPRSKRRASFPLPKPPAIGERSAAAAPLVRPFALKRQLGITSRRA